MDICVYRTLQYNSFPHQTKAVTIWSNKTVAMKIIIKIEIRCATLNITLHRISEFKVKVKNFSIIYNGGRWRFASIGYCAYDLLKYVFLFLLWLELPAHDFSLHYPDLFFSDCVQFYMRQGFNYIVPSDRDGSIVYGQPWLQHIQERIKVGH